MKLTRESMEAIDRLLNLAIDEYLNHEIGPRGGTDRLSEQRMYAYSNVADEVFHLGPLLHRIIPTSVGMIGPRPDPAEYPAWREQVLVAVHSALGIS